jgi:hypothetical protein
MLPLGNNCLSPTAGPRPLEPVRAAVVGLGRSGIAHAAVLSTIPGCELVGVDDSRPSARSNLRGVGYTAPGFPSLEKLLEQINPSVVFVCAPGGVCARVARLALEAGAAVLVDRPLARTVAEADLWPGRSGAGHLRRHRLRRPPGQPLQPSDRGRALRRGLDSPG